MKAAISWIGYATLAFFSLLMLRITIPYFQLDDHVAFLRIKQAVIGNQVWKTAFYLHVFTSMMALIAGFTQFSHNILRRRAQLHRWMGKLYVAVILLISGPAGFVMGLYANGGWLSQLSFTLLAVFWWGFTWQAYRQILAGNIRLHQQMMWRSYALTLSAITLRVWKYLLVWAFRPQPMDVYMLVAWLGWVPNLLLVEGWIRWRMSHRGA
ncbi:MAG: DUF2306 domain-containing protein [Bacteroidia bacterium]|nr:DUF2306 domain-containing protein [Bacteroidia bacterium]